MQGDTPSLSPILDINNVFKVCFFEVSMLIGLVGKILWKGLLRCDVLIIYGKN